MPYITGIKTTLGNYNKGGLKNNNIRAASGKYSVIYAADETANTYAANFLTISGFNLNPGTDDVRIVNTATKATSTVTSTGTNKSGITVTHGDANDGHTSFTASNVISKSGYLEVFTDGVRSLNNINENDAHDASGKGSEIGNDVTDWEDYYNREADYNTTKNVRLTDDRYIRMFDMKQTNITNGYYPNMIMEGDDPVFGYLDNNGGGADASGAPASTAFYQRAKFDGSDTETDGTAKESYKEYLGKSLVGDQMGMAKDEGGRYYQISVSNYNDDYMTLYYDRYAELHNSNVWNGNLSYNTFRGNTAYTGNNNALAIDGIGAYTGRFQYPKIQVSGNSLTGVASVYLAYFDSTTKNIYVRDLMIGKPSITYSLSSNNITFTYNSTDYYTGYQFGNGRSSSGYGDKYVLVDGKYCKITEHTYYMGYYYYYTVEGISKSFTSDVYNVSSINLEGNNTSTTNALATSGSDNNDKVFEQYTNISEGYKSGDYYIDSGILNERHIAVTGAGNKFYDMVVTDDYHIVLIYYDEENSRLKMIYSDEVTGGNPTSEINWTESSINFPEYVGSYVSMDIDSNGYIHISAFDVTDSDLSYIYIDNYAATSCTHVSVDQFGSVGNWTKIKVNSSGVPYIAYCNATEYGQRDAIKLAYAKDAASALLQGVESGTRYTTGNWEYMTVPTITPAQGGDSKFQNVCLDFDSDGTPVVGYLGTNLEFGKALGE